jgi:hypothetical protein
MPTAPALDAYVTPGMLPLVTGPHAAAIIGPFGSDIVWTTLSPVYFNFWLQQQSLTRAKGAEADV